MNQQEKEKYYARYPVLSGNVSKQMDSDSPVNPFRKGGASDGVPSLEAVARGILKHEPLVREVIRRLVWVDPELLTEMIASARTHKDAVLEACKNGTFGRDYVAAGAQPFEGREI